MFKTCQLIKPDKTGINWHRKHSPHDERTRNTCKWTRTDREYYCPLRFRERYLVRCDRAFRLFYGKKWKKAEFSETIAASNLKVGRCRQLIELMKICE